MRATIRGAGTRKKDENDKEDDRRKGMKGEVRKKIKSKPF